MKTFHHSQRSLYFRGIIALLFGLFALTYPHVTLSILVTIFGIYVFASGLMTMLLALFSRDYDIGWWIYFLEGLVSMIVGIVVFCLPDMTAIVLVYLMALWAMITGIMQIIAYIKLHAIFENDLLLCLNGLLSIIISILLFRFPIVSIIMIAWILGFYAFIFGVLSLLSAIKQKQ